MNISTDRDAEDFGHRGSSPLSAAKPGGSSSSSCSGAVLVTEPAENDE